MRASAVFWISLAALAACASTPLPKSPFPAGLYGDWAVAPEYCADGWWRFAPDAVATAGETVCSVDEVFSNMSDPPSAAYRLTCQAEGEPSQPTWSLSLESRNTLSIDRNDGRGVVTLRRC